MPGIHIGIPLKPSSDQNMEDFRLKVFNAVNSYMFPVVEMRKSLFKVKSRKDIISFHNCEHRYIIHTCPDKACLKGSFVNRELPS